MILTKTQSQKEKKLFNNNFAIFIVNKDKKRKILDLTINEWLKKELKDLYVFEIDIKKEEELRNKILQYLNNFEYFIIIYNNTPFITKNLVLSIIEYAYVKKIKACKLFSGAVFESKYFILNKEIIYDNFYMQNQENFFVVENVNYNQ